MESYLKNGNKKSNCGREENQHRNLWKERDTVNSGLQQTFLILLKDIFKLDWQGRQQSLSFILSMNPLTPDGNSLRFYQQFVLCSSQQRVTGTSCTISSPSFRFRNITALLKHISTEKVVTHWKMKNIIHQSRMLKVSTTRTWLLEEAAAPSVLWKWIVAPGKCAKSVMSSHFLDGGQNQWSQWI